MNIYRLIEITDTILVDFEQLIPQLSAKASIPTKADLKDILNSNTTVIIVAEEDRKIHGILTLIFNKIPTGDKVWIEDVVVDQTSRGKGIGKRLVEFAIRFVNDKKIDTINLTSSPEREAANKLYRKLGFKKRETNVYRLTLNGCDP